MSNDKRYIWAATISLVIGIFIAAGLTKNQVVAMIIAFCTMIVGVIVYAKIEANKNKSISQTLKNMTQSTKDSITAARCSKRNDEAHKELLSKNKNLVMILHAETPGEDKKIKSVYYYLFKDSAIGNCYLNFGSRITENLGLPTLYLQADITKNWKYNPSELVYHGATVGGVSMGGVTEYGDYYYKKESLSGKYTLQVVDEVKGKDLTIIIKDIFVGDELLKQLRGNSVITKFIKNGKLELRHEVPKNHKDVFDQAMKSGNVMRYEDMMNVCYVDTLLTKEECNVFKNWIRTTMNAAKIE